MKSLVMSRLCTRKTLGFPKRLVLMSWKGVIAVLFSLKYPGPHRVFHYTKTVDPDSIESQGSIYSDRKRQVARLKLINDPTMFVFETPPALAIPTTGYSRPHSAVQ